MPRSADLAPIVWDIREPGPEHALLIAGAKLRPAVLHTPPTQRERPRGRPQVHALPEWPVGCIAVVPADDTRRAAALARRRGLAVRALVPGVLYRIA